MARPRTGCAVVTLAAARARANSTQVLRSISRHWNQGTRYRCHVTTTAVPLLNAGFSRHESTFRRRSHHGTNAAEAVHGADSEAGDAGHQPENVNPTQTWLDAAGAWAKLTAARAAAKEVV